MRAMIADLWIGDIVSFGSTGGRVLRVEKTYVVVMTHGGETRMINPKKIVIKKD